MANSLDPSVYLKFESREVFLQMENSVIHQWRDISVLGWIQTLQECLASMDDEVSDWSLHIV